MAAKPLNEARYLGVTPPISTNPPSEIDLRLSKRLSETLEKMGYTEAFEESQKRESVLGRLNVMVRDFVRNIALQRGLPECVARDCGGKIFTFGSYRLGVHAAGSDIDTLCVVPQHVTRADFFSIFYEELLKCPDVSEVTRVPDAYVPVMKMVFSGIPIDLVFARLLRTNIPDNLDLLDHSNLRNLDEKCILSLNGSRTTDEILRLVPNVATFHAALKCIKIWAKKRALYGNVTGYLGGVACAMLVARICQLYPNAAPSTIISRFFLVYMQWEWPNPVLLKKIEDIPALPMKVWNPKAHASDRLHRMPVITPAFPSMCSTHNISLSTQQVLKREFERGYKCSLCIEQGDCDWSELFQPSDFFCQYRHFIQIIATAKSKEEFLIWSSYVESRIRIMSGKLEYIPHILGAPPYPRMFEWNSAPNETLEDVLAHHKLPQPTAALAVGDKRSLPDGELEQPLAEVATETSDLRIYSACFYIALKIETRPAGVTGAIRLDLHRPVAEFKELLISRCDRHTADMEVTIRDMRREDLPEYLFEEVKRPPVRSSTKT